MNQKKPGLGATYLAEFENILAGICDAPQRYPIEIKPDIQRRRMKKFPFTILFRTNSDSIQILAVAHHRQRPKYWLVRL